jgi:hypothetical protein
LLRCKGNQMEAGSLRLTSELETLMVGLSFRQLHMHLL